MSKYTRGQIVFILLSDRLVQEVVVQEVKDQEYTLSLELAGCITLPEDRIFASRKEAEARLKAIREQKNNTLTYMDKITANILGNGSVVRQTRKMSTVTNSAHSA